VGLAFEFIRFASQEPFLFRRNESVFSWVNGFMCFKISTVVAGHELRGSNQASFCKPDELEQSMIQDGRQSFGAAPSFPLGVADPRLVVGNDLPPALSTFFEAT